MHGFHSVFKHLIHMTIHPPKLNGSLLGMLIGGLIFLSSASTVKAELKIEDQPTFDLKKLQAVAKVYVRDLEKLRNATQESDLEIKSTLVPNLLAFELAKEILKFKKVDTSRELFLLQIVSALKKKKLKQPLSAVRVQLSNLKHTKDILQDQTVFTLQGKLPGSLIGVKEYAKGKSKKGKSLKTIFSFPPKDLRIAKIRIKKFYKLSKNKVTGTNRREPIISKPKTVSLIEGKPVVAEIRFSTTKLTKGARYTLSLKGIKKYTGPFVQDIFDLNEDRKWKEISPVQLRLSLPPSGTKVPKQLQKVLTEVLPQL